MEKGNQFYTVIYFFILYNEMIIINFFSFGNYIYFYLFLRNNASPSIFVFKTKSMIIDHKNHNHFQNGQNMCP